MTRGVRRDARIFYEGKRGGHLVTTTSEALDRHPHPSEALDRLDLDTAIESPSEALDRHHDTAPEAFGPYHDTPPKPSTGYGRATRCARLPSVAVLASSCFPYPVSPFESTRDSTATAPRSSPADSFGARGAPASLVPRTVPAGGRLGVARQRARATFQPDITLNPGQPISWRTERARRVWRRSRHGRGGRRSRPPARAERASLRRPYPSGEAEGAPRPRPRTPGTASEASRDRGARISDVATASAPRAFGVVAGGVVSPSACARGPRAFGVVAGGVVAPGAWSSAPMAFRVASPAWLPRSEERVTGSNIDETEDAVSTDVHT